MFNMTKEQNERIVDYYSTYMPDPHDFESRLINDVPFVGKTSVAGFVGVHQDMFDIYTDKSLTYEQKGQQLHDFLHAHDLRSLSSGNLVVDTDGVAVEFGFL